MSLTFNTERLVVRPLEPKDAPHIFLLDQGAEVLKYVHDVPFADTRTAEQWILDIAWGLPQGIGRWAITLRDGPWIGRCSLRRQPDCAVLMGNRLIREQ